MTTRAGQLYKVLAENGQPHHGGTGVWPLPNGKPGEWLEITGELVPCENGLHLCRQSDLLGWLGPVIHTAEYDGEMIEHNDKIVVRRARLIERLDTWNDRTARLFAADCAERVLHLYESKYPDDSRVRNAIEVARKVANGELDISELAAAGDAAGAAAWAAAGDAEREWQQARLFEYLDGTA